MQAARSSVWVTNSRHQPAYNRQTVRIAGIIAALLGCQCGTERAPAAARDEDSRPSERRTPEQAPGLPGDESPSSTPRQPDAEETTVTLGTTRALAWNRAGNAIAVVGDGVALWRGHPLAQAEHATLREPAEHVDASTDYLVVCETSAICVFDDRLAVRRRLSCGSAREPRLPTWSPNGSWVAAHCTDGATLETCLWDARTGRRRDCTDSELLPWHNAPFAFSADSTALALTTAEGIEIFDLGRLEETATVPVVTGRDASVLLSWMPSGRQLMAIGSSGGQVFDARGSGPVREFEILGQYASHAWSSRGDEFAVIYAEALAVHRADGSVALQRTTDAGAGAVVRWSADAQYLSVEWADDQRVGFDVYARSDLHRVFGAVAEAIEGWLPIAWQPSGATFAYPSGASVVVRSLAGASDARGRDD